MNWFKYNLSWPWTELPTGSQSPTMPAAPAPEASSSSEPLKPSISEPGSTNYSMSDDSLDWDYAQLDPEPLKPSQTLNYDIETTQNPPCR